MSQITRVNKQDLYNIIESDYIPLFHPFKEYLGNLPSAELKRNINGKGSIDEPPSKFRLSSADKERDYIRELAQTIRVKGGEQEQMLWYRYLKKWLVGMVASWLSDDVVNNVILVLIGEQGAYKTT